MASYYTDTQWTTMHPRWDQFVVQEPSVVHRYNPYPQPRRPALRRKSNFSFSPHFHESPEYGRHRWHSSIHPFLASHDCPSLIWDISINPKKSLRTYHHYDADDLYRILSQSATDTPSRTLDVVHLDGLLDARWPIRAGRAPSRFSRSHSYVTVGDTIYALYEAFQANIGPAQYDTLCTDLRFLKDGVVDAYYDRCWYGKSKAEGKKEFDRGLKVVDFFMGSLTWVGLTFGQSTRELRLHVRPGRPQY